MPAAPHNLGTVPLFSGLPTVVLEEGQLRVSRFSPAGVEVVLAVIEAPAALGELALLDGQPRDATITAQQPVSVRLVPRSAFLALMRAQPQVMEGLLATLAAMVRAANARHADLLGLDLPGRLARWLLRRAGEGATAGTTVTMKQSQSELAAELGATPSTLNRVLHDFEAQGIIELDGSTITLRKVERLQDLLT